MSCIYVLKDPRSGDRRYVGQAKNPKRRLREHISGSKDRGDTLKQRWVKELKQLGCVPEMEILEHCDEREVDRREVWWIRHGRAEGWPLVNMAGGGQGDPLQEQREQFREMVSSAIKKVFGDVDVFAYLVSVVAPIAENHQGSRTGDRAAILLAQIRARMGLEDRIRKLEELIKVEVKSQ